MLTSHLQPYLRSTRLSGPNRHQIMRVEDFQAFEKDTQSPGDGRQLASDGWRQCNALKLKPAACKKTADLVWAQRTRLRIGWVEPEIIRQDQAVSLYHPEHIFADVAPNIRIKN